MMAANYRHIGGLENRLGRHYSRFSTSWPAAPLAAQSLARRKLPNHGSNRPSQASAKGHGVGRVVARRAPVKSTVPDLAEVSAVWNVRQREAARRCIRGAQLAMPYRGDAGSRLMHAAPSFRLGCRRAEV